MHPNIDTMPRRTSGPAPMIDARCPDPAAAIDLLLTEIASIEAAKEALPDNSALRTLCDLAIRPLRAHAEAIQKRPPDSRL